MERSYKQHKKIINKNLIGKSCNLLNKAAKLKIYYAHIYPHLSYTNTVWGGHLMEKQKNNLEKIQKYCIRAIMNKSKTHHTDPLFKILRIMKIDEIYHFETSKLGYMIKNKLVPIPISDMFHSFGRKNHSYNTRQKRLPNIKKHTCSDYNQSFLCKCIIIIVH